MVAISHILKSFMEVVDKVLAARLRLDAIPLCVIDVTVSVFFNS